MKVLMYLSIWAFDLFLTKCKRLAMLTVSVFTVLQFWCYHHQLPCWVGPPVPLPLHHSYSYQQSCIVFVGFSIASTELSTLARWSSRGEHAWGIMTEIVSGWDGKPAASAVLAIFSMTLWQSGPGYGTASSSKLHREPPCLPLIHHASVTWHDAHDDVTSVWLHVDYHSRVQPISPFFAQISYLGYQTIVLFWRIGKDATLKQYCTRTTTDRRKMQWCVTSSGVWQSVVAWCRRHRAA